ncbi:virulence associated lipoprotein, partial [Borrelia hermsii]|uniref:virulence associated lipoprotein n=1 Tax=Borrelia hermsii TaxID=140 RepID=UPI00046C9390
PESPAIQAIQAQIKQHKREFIIAKLKLRVPKYEKMLNDHINYAWIEDGDVQHRWKNYGPGGKQYYMSGTDRGQEIFAIISSPYNRNWAYKEPGSKDARSKIYLAFEYDENLIGEFREVLSLLGSRAKVFLSVDLHGTTYNPNEYNNLVQEIADKTGEYACNYFEVAFGELIKKQNNLNSLSYDMLQALDQKFDKLIAEREMHIKDAKTILNHYYTNKRKFEDDETKLKDYLIKHKTKFNNSFEVVKTLAREIKNILDTI